MEAIILAGGLGTRLAARLNGIPKPMAPICGHPFLEFLLARLWWAGCSRVLLSVGHLHIVIQDHFGSSYQGMPIDYVVETTPLGTGGAIRRALLGVEEDVALVLNGDTFVDLDFAELLEFHQEVHALLTLTLSYSLENSRYGRVMPCGNHIRAFEAQGSPGPGWINAGLYVLPRALAWPKAMGKRFSFERDFLASHLQQLRPRAYRSYGSFLDIGVPEDLDRAQVALAGLVGECHSV
jgi:D-glycero-alpha-D-manno-heptose 1-phosphate guanylyltransferase